MLMIGRHLSVQHSGSLSSDGVNGYMAVEKNSDKKQTKKIQKSTLVDLPAISNDPVGLGKGGGWFPPTPTAG